MVDDPRWRESDITRGDWVDQFAPSAAKPFLRLARIDRPIGIWLLMFPCWWGVALASSGWPDLYLLVIFAIGATIMRSAGCAYNDLVDRDIDAKVARTATRPLPNGDLSPAQARIFIGILCFLGLIVLLQLNLFAITTSVLSIAIVAVYPFMKYVTSCPQIFLGLAFSWGAFVGWSAVRADISLAAICLYLGGVCWTIGYDTIYAHQDKKYDVLAGVKSAALLFGAKSKFYVLVLYIMSVCLISASVVIAGAGILSAAAFIPVACFLVWQVVTVDLSDHIDCLSKFKSNSFYGGGVFVTIVACNVV